MHLACIQTIWLNITSKTREWGIYIFFFDYKSSQYFTYFISHYIFKTHFSCIQPWHKYNFLWKKYMDWNLIDNRYSCSITFMYAFDNRLHSNISPVDFKMLLLLHWMSNVLKTWNGFLPGTRIQVCMKYV